MQNKSTAVNSMQKSNSVINNVDMSDSHQSSTQMSTQNNRANSQTIENQMESDKQQMQSIQREMRTIQDRMQVNQNKVQDIQNQMQNEQNKMLIIQNQMQNGQNQMQSIQSQIKNDQSQIKNIKTKMQNGQNQMQSIQSQIKNDQSQIQNIQNQMFTIQNRIQINQKLMQDNQNPMIDNPKISKESQKQIQSEQKKDNSKEVQIKDNLKPVQSIGNKTQANSTANGFNPNQTPDDYKVASAIQSLGQLGNTSQGSTSVKNSELKSPSSDFSRMPVVDICNFIIMTAVNSGASDIHMDPTDDGINVRIRIDGLLRDYFKLPRDIKQNVITRIKIMAGMNITETRLPQDGAIKDRLNGKDLDLRVSSLPTKRGEKIVIRIMDYSMSLKGIEYLYFSETNYNKVLKMLSTPNGIILVTGATGTGKSTTLYSFLQKLNVEGSNLITVEDPVEMDIEGVNQVQVNSDIGLDFAAVLRSILRQDPNVIMIGEIRDSETAQIAVRASITGHLVLSTIHTNNSLNTIERLLDMDVERYLLASALEGIVSQNLARMLCNKCKIKRPVTAAEKNLFKSVLGQDVKEIYSPNPSGCPHCNHGYKGRIAVQEVLLINQDIRDAISAGIRKDDLRKLVYNKDVITMLQDGLFKVVAGFTTTDEILKLIEVDDADFGVK